jgi:hypothetical protein
VRDPLASSPQYRATIRGSQPERQYYREVPFVGTRLRAAASDSRNHSALIHHNALVAPDKHIALNLEAIYFSINYADDESLEESYKLFSGQW